MFKRLRVQLTVICTLATAAVLVGVAGISLHFSLVHLEQQAKESFNGNINTILYHLYGQPVLDQTWLAQTETDNDIWIRIESQQAQLQHTRQNTQRQKYTQAALDYAEQELSLVPFAAASSLSSQPEIAVFGLVLDNKHLLAGVTYVPYASGVLRLVVVKDCAAQQAAAQHLRAKVMGCVLAAAALLTLFSWFFSGRAIQPVEEAHRSQREFVSSASHELRSPLAVLELSADTLCKEPERAGAIAPKIQRECKRMARLVSDLLFLANADNGQCRLQWSWASPKTMLLSTMERFEPAAEKKGIRLALNLPVESLPEIYCDKQRVEQVLSILMENALRFTPVNGIIRLEGCLIKAGVALIVADSGPGIPTGEKTRIFERFYQGDCSRTDKEHYGLGLSIASEIAAQHRARLTVKDADLGGAEFSLELRTAVI